MSTQLRISPESGYQSLFQPGEYDFQWLGLEILRLDEGEVWQGDLDKHEAALVILSGRCTVSVNDDSAAQWEGLGSRADLFSGPPAAVYVPRHSKVSVTAESKLELALAKAPAEIDLRPTVIRPDEVKVVSAGAANWRRDVRLIIPPGSPVSQRLIVGETLNPPGNWSGIPPHKHEEISETENYLEEFYLYKVKPADSYGLQLTYREGQDQSHFVRNDDVVLLSGYHPTVAAPGTTICYLWTLSGESKAYDIAIDPRFDWVGNTEAVFREVHHG
jgi:5-deoxy-glucuronate isomerase